LILRSEKFLRISSFKKPICRRRRRRRKRVEGEKRVFLKPFFLPQTPLFKIQRNLVLRSEKFLRISSFKKPICRRLRRRRKGVREKKGFLEKPFFSLKLPHLKYKKT
ncbi:MAG: hypothetical protein AAF849_23465, partial [Bacteroidota bacterium]